MERETDVQAKLFGTYIFKNAPKNYCNERQKTLFIHIQISEYLGKTHHAMRMKQINIYKRTNKQKLKCLSSSPPYSPLAITEHTSPNIPPTASYSYSLCSNVSFLFFCCFLALILFHYVYSYLDCIKRMPTNICEGKSAQMVAFTDGPFPDEEKKGGDPRGIASILKMLSKHIFTHLNHKSQFP